MKLAQKMSAYYPGRKSKPQLDINGETMYMGYDTKKRTPTRHYYTTFLQMAVYLNIQVGENPYQFKISYPLLFSS